MSREAGHKPEASSPPEPSLPPGPPSRPPPRTVPNGPWLHLFGYVLLALAVLWWWQGRVSALTVHELSYREFRQHLGAATLAELRVGEHEIEGLVQLAPAAPSADAAARRVLVDHREQLETLASALLEHETLDAAALQSLLADSA